MSEALKPCPFCGEQPKIVTRDVEPQNDHWYSGRQETFVLCQCGACLFDGAFHEGFWDAETRAVAAWNLRDTPAAAAEVRDNILNERGPLEGMGLTGDQINAVLAVLDDATPAAAAEPITTESGNPAPVEASAITVESGRAAAAEPVVWALRFLHDSRLCLSTIFDTEAEAKEYAERCSPGTEVIPLFVALRTAGSKS